MSLSIAKDNLKQSDFKELFLIKFKLFVYSYLSADKKNIGLINLFKSVYKANQYKLN